MSNIQAIVIGDSILDHWIRGSLTVNEAENITTLDQANSTFVPGGAANIVRSLIALHIPTHFITLFGNLNNNPDLGSQYIWEEYKEYYKGNLQISFVQEVDYSVEEKLRITTPHHGLALRVDDASENLHMRGDRAIAHKKQEELYAVIMRVLKDCATERRRQPEKKLVVVISDYGKGVFSSKADLQAILDWCNRNYIPTVVAPKFSPDSELKQLTDYQFATLLQLNNHAATNFVSITCGSANLARQLFIKAATADIKGIVLTKGKFGISLAYKQNSCVCQHDLQLQNKYNGNLAVGAGDVVTAVLASQLACTEEEYKTVTERFYLAAYRANIGASKAVSSMPPSTCRISDYGLEQASIAAGLLPKQKVADLDVIRDDCGLNECVLVNGCFDQLHPGHISLLTEAKKLGGSLVVALNTDDSISNRKGSTRPFMALTERIAMLSALACVDYIVTFDSEWPEEVITTLKPRVVVKGAEYQTEDFLKTYEARLIQNQGGIIKFIPMLSGYSTTAQNRRTLESYKKAAISALEAIT